MGYSSWISGSAKRSDVEKHLDALFEAAVVEESVDVVQYLLKKGAQPPKGHRKETDTAEKEKERGFVWVDMIDLAFLCSTPDAKEKADLLIKKCGYNGVVPADWVNYAIENCKVGFLKAVLTTGKDYYKPNAHQCDHLHFAVDRKTPNLEVLQILLDAHLEDVNKLSKSTNYAGEAPIHVATRNRSPEAIKLLREHGANVDIKGKNYRRTVSCISCCSRLLFSPCIFRPI
jgi:ankyrin repeat protein